mgnify:CR=1 FL=1
MANNLRVASLRISAPIRLYLNKVELSADYFSRGENLYLLNKNGMSDMNFCVYCGYSKTKKTRVRAINFRLFTMQTKVAES